MKPIIANSEDLLGAAKEYLVANRPTSAQHLENGKYAAVLEGWKAQEQVVQARLAKEVASARLTTCPRDSINELLISKFGFDLPDAPAYAEGTVTLYRQRLKNEAFTSGIIPAGTKFRRQVDTIRGLKEAYFVTTEPVYVSSIDGVTLVENAVPEAYHQFIDVPIVAVQPGAASNHPQLAASLSDNCFRCTSTLFDSKLMRVGGEAAGGSDNELEKGRALGKYLGLGKFGPTMASIYAGIMSTPGVVHCAVSEDLVNGGLCGWVADESWAWSERLNARVLANVKANGWLGFGCKLTLGRVIDYPIRVSANVVLKSRQFLNNQAEVLANIRKSLRSYFDDRLDWYTWTLEGVMSAICLADHRVMGIERDSGGIPICSVRGVATQDEDKALTEPSKSLGTFELHNYSGLNENWILWTSSKASFVATGEAKIATLKATRLHWLLGDQRTSITFRTPQVT